jgi:hypothetical protein
VDTIPSRSGYNDTALLHKVFCQNISDFVNCPPFTSVSENPPRHGTCIFPATPKANPPSAIVNFFTLP